MQDDERVPDFTPRELIESLSGETISSAARTRLLIASMVASMWVTTQMTMLYVTDLLETELTIKISVYSTILVFFIYFLVLKSPDIATKIKLYYDSEADIVTIFVGTMIGTAVFVLIIVIVVEITQLGELPL